MTISIRTATHADIPTVLALWLDAGAERTLTDDEDSVAALLARDPSALILAEDDDRAVGSIIAGWDGWRGQLYRLVVTPAARRRGIGTALVAEAERRLHDLGVRRVAAIVVDDADAAMAFWRAVGYERAPHTRFTKTLQHGS